MNSVVSCPMCYGNGKIRITDYVEHMVQQEWPIKCPVCIGLGVVHSIAVLFGVREEVHL